jgi:hypothetical protein
MKKPEACGFDKSFKNVIEINEIEETTVQADQESIEKKVLTINDTEQKEEIKMLKEKIVKFEKLIHQQNYQTKELINNINSTWKHQFSSLEQYLKNITSNLTRTHSMATEKLNRSLQNVINSLIKHPKPVKDDTSTPSLPTLDNNSQKVESQNSKTKFKYLIYVLITLSILMYSCNFLIMYCLYPKVENNEYEEAQNIQRGQMISYNAHQRSIHFHHNRHL